MMKYIFILLPFLACSPSNQTASNVMNKEATSKLPICYSFSKSTPGSIVDFITVYTRTKGNEVIDQKKMMALYQEDMYRLLLENPLSKFSSAQELETKLSSAYNTICRVWAVNIHFRQTETNNFLIDSIRWRTNTFPAKDSGIGPIVFYPVSNVHNDAYQILKQFVDSIVLISQIKTKL